MNIIPKEQNNIEIKTKERGWAGHFCCAYDCLFKRNTLIYTDDVYVVVSTVGNYMRNGKKEAIGYERYFETMAFFADEKDHKYHDADVEKEIHFDSPWSLGDIDDDNMADNMHERVVKEIIERIKQNRLTTYNNG